MKALRLPARASAVTYWFRSGGPRFTPFVSASLRSRWQGDAIEPGFLGQPVNPRPALSYVVAKQDLSGSQVIHPMPLPSSTTPVEPIRPRHYRPHRCCPRPEENEGFGVQENFGACHSASTSTAYASPAPLPTPMQSSFPAGWLAFAGRGLNSLDHFVGFRSHHDLPPDLRLA